MVVVNNVKLRKENFFRKGRRESCVPAMEIDRQAAADCGGSEGRR
jgi:hypothetical protein